MQQAARATAGAGSVPNGLASGGLEVLTTGPNVQWTGASAPVASGNTVTITQNAQQALLAWKTFNVGKDTTVHFDQSAGAADSGKWIAFNKIFDPSGNPTQILGQIKADGQVYLINQNGIIFGAGSQVNTRALVASSIPINDNLVNQGLLNNKDAQFLFSALDVPGGSDGTPAFIAPARPTAAQEAIGVIVEKGATISGPVSSDGNGGRVMLVGANVRNDGSISTPSGQTILAAGLQVGIQAHDSGDPSLRGLDVWIGDVGTYGNAANNGLIESHTGSVLMAGRQVSQSGIIDSSTSVNLNGRIDLIASYGAAANPNYDNTSAVGGGGPIFLNQFTGTVAFGPTSVTRILPDYTGTGKIPGTSLPENSQVNVEGLSIQMLGSSMLLAPHANVSFRAGTWPYVDVAANRTIFIADGTTVEDALSSNFAGGGQRFFYSDGQVFLDSGSLIDVSGSTNVFVPLSQHILTVQFRGSELASSPLQRNSVLRGKKLVVDIQVSGNYGGSYWVGSPLGDLTGVAGIIERNVAQLTASGGVVNIKSGNSIAVQPGATVDVSGGYFRNEGGTIQTTRLLRNGTLVDMANATPDRTYDGVYNGLNTVDSSKWGVSKTFAAALAPLGAHVQKEYISGADGGAINFTAPSVIIGGDLVGQTITGPKQVISPASAPVSPAAMASLSFTFKAEAQFVQDANTINYYDTSPTPPEIRFTSDKPDAAAFVLAPGGSLPTSLTSRFALSTSWWNSGGFGSVSVDNPDGALILPSGLGVAIPAGGSLTAKASNMSIDGTITAPGGTISLTAYNYSPYDYKKLVATDPFLSSKPALGVVAGRGMITLGADGKIDVSGMLVDDRASSQQAVTTRRILDGGTVSLEAFMINLAKGSLIDASGGARAKPISGFEFGNGGAISVLAGRDPNQLTGSPTALLIGGQLSLDGTLAAYSANQGGSLAIRANLIQIGGSAGDPTMLVLSPEFFRGGGFTSYSLTGIGKAIGTGYIPAIRVAGGTIIEPVAESLVLAPNRSSGGGLSLVPILKPVGERSPVSITMAATGADDPFTTGILEVRGDIVIEKGAVIRTDPGAKVLIGTDSNLVKTLADTVSIDGTIDVPGGTVAVFTRNKFRLAPDVEAATTSALPTVYLGPDARISTAGTVVPKPDPFGRRIGVLYDGGTISLYGNIVAESGAVLDVSGTSGIFDIHPSQLTAAGQSALPVNSGLNTAPYNLRSVATRVDSNGGTLALQGTEMLLSDATLLGHAGGPTAVGGTLSIFSGRYYAPGLPRTSADINLVVTQSGQSLSGASGSRGIGKVVRDSLGAVVPGMGYFAADRFQQGGFASLDLGFKFIADASPIPYGGNVEFVGPVSIAASGRLRVAGGGIIKANSSVNLSANYIAVGQEYRAPIIPGVDAAFVAFQQDPPSVISGATYYPSPTYGSGTVNFDAKLIDIGTTVFQNTGKVAFTAVNGDIRGDGTLNVAGDLVLTAGQIYPNTLATFNVFAYDHAGVAGSVTIRGSGIRPMPYSAGGNLNIYASTITQGGTLRAPFGSITIGWDGNDLDPSTPAFDSPINPIVGTGLTVPTALTVVLGSSSVTSVSAVDPATGRGLVIPFGLSADGFSWIDPRGVNVTVSGLPQKGIAIAGNNIIAQTGSVVDIRGGGDLLGYRWVSGTGGSQDLLGEPAGAWGSGTTYKAGDLVTYNGQTWSARVAIDPTNFTTAPSPTTSNIYWAKVDTSYAILPGYTAEYAPYSVNNTGPNATLLGGDPGFTSSSLKLGDRIYLDAGSGLQAGYYTLLPRRYALLPGAFLVTPKSSGTVSQYGMADGSTFTSGYLVNAFNQPAQIAGVRSLFEVDPPTVIASRAQYDVLGANDFIKAAAKRLDVANLQRLPMDSGTLSFQGNTALQLDGSVLTGSLAGGRGASVDVSSNANIYVVGGTGSAPAGTAVVLSSDLLNSWGAESLLIGGLRRSTTNGMAVDVHTSAITLNNPGATLSLPEITLASKAALTVAGGSNIASSGSLSQTSEPLLISGDGTLLRVSGDTSSSIARSSTTGSVLPVMTIGAGASLSGAGLILDSSYATSLSPTALLSASALALGGGQISIVLSPPSAGLSGSVVSPHLTLSGSLLAYVQSVDSLALTSYCTVDIYGAGTFGSPTMGALNIYASGIRGYDRGSVTLTAGSVTLANPSGSTTLAAPALPLSGSLQVNAGTVNLGANAFSVAGYTGLGIAASNELLATADGSLTLPGTLSVTTPLITGLQGVSYNVSAAGSVSLLPGVGIPGISGGLGAGLTVTGSSISANTAIRLPSGNLVLHALSGGLTVGGSLSADGTSQTFYDITRYADAGSIKLFSDTGAVTLNPGSLVSVAGSSGGGNAGSVEIHAPAGTFVNNGSLLGSAATGGTTGSFLLDAGSIVSFANINNPLESGGFFENRNIRVRTGSVTINGTAHARSFTLSADQGSITVTGTGLLDASGLTAVGTTGALTGVLTGGSITLAARDNVTVQSGAEFTVAASQFSSAGKGGNIQIDAGTEQNGVVNAAALLDLQTGSTIDLSVASFVAGTYTTVGSSAFNGQFQGTLHLRAPQNAAGSSLQVAPINSTIAGASSIMVEGYRLYDLTAFGGLITSTLEQTIKTDGNTFVGTSGTNSPTYATMHNTILANNLALDPVVVFSPGVEIINRATATPLNYSFNSISSAITVIPESGTNGSVTFISGTPGNNKIRTDIAAIISSAAGVTTNLAGNTLTSLAAGDTVSFVGQGTITFVSGSGGAMPVTLSPGARYTQSSAGASASVSTQGSLITLNAAGSSSITLAAGTRVTLPNGTSGTNTTNRIRASVAGTITSPTGVVTVLAANTNTQVANGSSISLGAAGTLSFASGGTGGPIQVALASGSFTTTGAIGLTPVTGDIVLGKANQTGTNPDGTALTSYQLSTGDWDLSTFRYGANSAPGILTLRAKGDLIFNNTLSDGFTPVTASTAGNSSMWLATLMKINTSLPLNAQSWSFRLSAGADLGAADYRSVLPVGSLAAGKGSLLVGEFYDAVPNETASGTAPATGTSGLTSNSIRISKDATNRGTRYEVIRTGTGDITINAGLDVQLRNQFATIYTAGVAIPTPTTVYQANDFVVPILNKTPSMDGAGVTLGSIQQTYAAVWSLGGGDVSISAQANIGHYTIYNGPSATINDGQKTITINPGDLIIDSSRQLPTDWLYRRAYVDFNSGLFASNGGIDGSDVTKTVTDPSASTAWWVDFSNFFEGVGALGGGNVALIAGKDVVNVDAFTPTNARMAGKNPLTGINIAPSAANLLELGGGDVSVRTGNNIDGGVYYVERGTGTLFAGGSITTNWARSPQLGILDKDNTSNQFGTDHIYSSETWLPTTLFVGDSNFNVRALKDVLLGPASNTFLLPQGFNNKFWYKTYFDTYSSTAGVDVASFGGSVKFRTVATPSGASSPTSVLGLWFDNQNLFSGDASSYNASNFQPWLRLSEVDTSSFQQVFSLGAPSLRATAFSGDLDIVGPLSLFPSPTGSLELVASGSILGLQPTGSGSANGSNVSVWTTSTVALSDADPGLFPSITTPIAYQSLAGRSQASAIMNTFNQYSGVGASLAETGSYSGQSSAASVKRALHSPATLHKNDTVPVRFYASTGTITGLTLFASKASRIIAGTDITDVAFYIQNVSKNDISIISAGRDVIPYNENAPLRALASDASQGNYIAGQQQVTATGSISNVLAGDIQINGPGVLEVLAGRNLDLGTGPNYTDGTGVGITSIGNQRNPFLPFDGADIVAMSGVAGNAGGAAVGLAGSNLDFTQISLKGSSKGPFASKELQDVASLETFFAMLRQAADEYAASGSYASGYAAIGNLFGTTTGTGEIYTRARDIRTTSGGAITIMAPSGGLTMASDIFGNPLTPPGIVTEYGGVVSIFTNGNVDIGRARIFTLRGGDMTIWSSTGNIAAGTASKTVVTAPPTRVVIDTTSADVATDLGGLATGGGIGVLASVAGVAPGDVSLIAPKGTVDAGDAGIQATGNLRIAAAQVLNADNISAAGTTSGVPSAPTVAAPNVGGLTSASSSSAAANSAANNVSSQARTNTQTDEQTPSIITVEVLGYGGGDTDEG